MAAATAIASATGVAVTTTPGNSGDKDIFTTRSDTIRVDLKRTNLTGIMRVILAGKDSNGNYYTLYDFAHGNNISIGRDGQFKTMLPDTIQLQYFMVSGTGTLDYTITGR